MIVQCAGSVSGTGVAACANRMPRRATRVEGRRPGFAVAVALPRWSARVVSRVISTTFGLSTWRSRPGARSVRAPMADAAVNRRSAAITAADASTRISEQRRAWF